MYKKIFVALVVAGTAAGQATAQQYHVPEPNAAQQRGTRYSLSDTNPVVRPASTPIPTRGNSGVYQPTAAPVGTSYLNNGCDSRGGCDSRIGGNVAGGCDSRGGCDSVVSGCGSCDSCDSCNSCSGTPGTRYGKLIGGWNEAYDINVPASNTDFGLNSGWALGAGVGRQLRCNLRHEIEVLYRNNTSDNRVISPAGGPQQVTDTTGNINCISLANLLYYDVSRLRFAGVTPYVGGGIGGAYVDADFSDGVNTYAISDAAFSYTGILGAQKQFNQRVTGFAEYRFFGTSNLDFDTPMGTTDVKYESHGVLVGLRFVR